MKKSENNQEPPAELIIQIQAKETALNGAPSPHGPPTPTLTSFVCVRACGSAAILMGRSCLSALLTWRCVAAAKRGAFEMYEAQVHEELSQLVGDSGALHKFLEAALRLENHAFESALGPVSPSLVHLTEGGSYAAPSIMVRPLPSPQPLSLCVTPVPGRFCLRATWLTCLAPCRKHRRATWPPTRRSATRATPTR